MPRNTEKNGDLAEVEYAPQEMEAELGAQASSATTCVQPAWAT